MAKKQRKVPQLKYNIKQYTKYQHALELMGEIVPDKKRPTKKSVENIKKTYQARKAELKREGLQVPTLKELEASYRQPANVSRETPAPTYVDTPIAEQTINEQRIDELRAQADRLLSELEMHVNMKTAYSGVKRKRAERIKQAKDALNQKLQFARQKVGDEAFVEYMQNSDIYNRIIESEYRYAYEVEDAIDTCASMLDDWITWVLNTMV